MTWNRFSALLVLCQGNPPVTDVFPLQQASNLGFGGSFADNLEELYIVDHGKGKFPVLEKYFVGVDISLYFLQNVKRVFTIKEIYLI